MKGSKTFQLLIILLLAFICHSRAEHEENFQDCNLSNASVTCPENSFCSTSICVCNVNFEHDAQWTTGTSYCRHIVEENKLILYWRTSAKKEYLIIAIFMVVTAAALAVGVMFVIKLLRPLKNTKFAYIKLRRGLHRHQQNRARNDEIDLIAMQERNATQMFVI